MKLIGTHNGTFHCDEALAVFLLRKTKAYNGAGDMIIGLFRRFTHTTLTLTELVRSRNPSILEKCDIVVDVGAVYDERIQRFDHHQREFSETFGHGFSTKLSSAGLIYK